MFTLIIFAALSVGGMVALSREGKDSTSHSLHHDEIRRIHAQNDLRVMRAMYFSRF